MRPFFGRPFQVIALNGFVTAIEEQIQEDVLRALVGRPLIGSLDQFSDSTDLIENPPWRPVLRQPYQQ